MTFLKMYSRPVLSSLSTKFIELLFHDRLLTKKTPPASREPFWMYHIHSVMTCVSFRIFLRQPDRVIMNDAR